MPQVWPWHKAVTLPRAWVGVVAGCRDGLGLPLELQTGLPKNALVAEAFLAQEPFTQTMSGSFEIGQECLLGFGVRIGTNLRV